MLRDKQARDRIAELEKRVADLELTLAKLVKDLGGQEQERRNKFRTHDG